MGAFNPIGVSSSYGIAHTHSYIYIYIYIYIYSIADCIAHCIDCAYLALNCIGLEKVMPSKVNEANYKKGIKFPSKFLIRTCLPLIWQLFIAILN